MPRSAGRRPSSTKRDLLRADFRRLTPEQISEALQALLDQSRLGQEERVHALASAVVVEALRPYWTPGRTPSEAHQALIASDPEIAAVIEAIAPMLVGRIESHEEACDLIASVEAMLGLPR